MAKEYAIKIENITHGLIFHMLFTKEEAEETKLFVGTIEMQTKNEKETTQYIDSKFMSIKDLYNWMKVL
jgi:hypothetical protein